MVLIISNITDMATSLVINWLQKAGIPWIRWNDFNFEQNDIGIKYGIGSNFTFIYNQKHYSSDDITHVWYRRFAASKLIKVNKNEEQDRMIGERINSFAHEEKQSLKYMLINALAGKKWINHPETSDINKLHQLETAKKTGLYIPETIITNSKQTLRDFIKENDAVIMKPISNIQSLVFDGVSYIPFTTEVDEQLLTHFGDTFFPMLFQKLIRKAYEIRTFYLDGAFYSMAMFTQKSDKTKLDFRNYDEQKPSRRVPYQLPSELETKLRLLMELLHLNSGSFDLIYTEEGEYCFLEVNPVGQFGMVSYPCNYYLEKKVAQLLSV